MWDELSNHYNQEYMVICFVKPMHKIIDIHNVTKIEYTMLSTEADMNLYEIYYINLWKPPLNVDDKAKDNLTITLPDLKWQEFVPANWDKWKEQLKNNKLMSWHKIKNEKIMRNLIIEETKMSI